MESGKRCLRLDVRLRPNARCSWWFFKVKLKITRLLINRNYLIKFVGRKLMYIFE